MHKQVFKRHRKQTFPGKVSPLRQKPCLLPCYFCNLRNYKKSTALTIPSDLPTWKVNFQMQENTPIYPLGGTCKQMLFCCSTENNIQDHNPGLWACTLCRQGRASAQTGIRTLRKHHTGRTVTCSLCKGAHGPWSSLLHWKTRACTTA